MRKPVIPLCGVTKTVAGVSRPRDVPDEPPASTEASYRDRGYSVNGGRIIMPRGKGER